MAAGGVEEARNRSRETREGTQLKKHDVDFNLTENVGTVYRIT